MAEVINIMRDDENEFARLAAAKLILEFSRETELEERLHALAEQFSDNDGAQAALTA